MTKEELYQLEGKLKERGYRRHPSINSADYALFKSFGERVNTKKIDLTI